MLIGIINVAARDKATSREQKVTITASTNLNKGEIDRMVQEARQNEAADRNQRELAEARNNADSLAYQTEKTLNELGDKTPANERQNIQDKIDGLREAVKGDDTDKIKRLSEDLQNAFYALSQQLYAQQQPGGNGNGRDHGFTPQPDDQGEVIEGEYR
jgi:molecular chaperone DnaK